MFKYQGIERWQGWFYSPNVCATFLAMTILLSIGLFVGLLLFKKCRCRSVALIGVGGWILLQQLLLGLTYSRGGYVGLWSGLAIAWIICRKHSIWIYGLSGIVMIMLLSNGATRIASIGQVGADASIANRILLWRGGAGMMAGHPVSGVVAPGEFYHAWYQPLWLNEHYRTMINDAFTLGSWYGLWAFALYYLLFLTLIYLGWRYVACFGRYRGVFACALGAVVSYFVCASFSTMYEHGFLKWTIMGVLFVIALALVVAVFRNKTLPRWWDFAIPLGATLLISSLVFVWGLIENSHLNYRWEYREVPSIDGKPLLLCQAVPRREFSGRLFCFVDEKWENIPYYSDFIRDFARPFLQNGYAVNVINPNPGIHGKINAIKILQDIIAENPATTFDVFGIGEGAQMAILAMTESGAPEIDKVALLNVPATWPFEELSPIRFIDRYRGELLLAASGDKIFDVELLAEKRHKAGLPTRCVSRLENSVEAGEILSEIILFFGRGQK